jgi:hypothetical protein
MPNFADAAPPDAKFEGRFEVRFARRKTRLAAVWKSLCDKASDHAPVMLHLRACYVSKAAILTIPATTPPVENRSPA